MQGEDLLASPLPPLETATLRTMATSRKGDAGDLRAPHRSRLDFLIHEPGVIRKQRVNCYCGVVSPGFDTGVCRVVEGGTGNQHRTRTHRAAGSPDLGINVCRCVCG